MRHAAPLLILVLAACPTVQQTVYDGPPVAEAGPDQVLTPGMTARLSAEDSFCPTDRTCTYSWYVESAPADSQANHLSFGEDNGTSASIEVPFTPDSPQGEFVLGLVVEDGIQQSEPDMVVLIVESSNNAPTAECGEDLEGELGERLVFDGSASHDLEGAALTWAWQLVEAPEGSQVVLYDGLTATPSLVPDLPGAYHLSLVVSDGLDASAPCYTTALVADDAQAPLADAGDTQTLTPCEEVIHLNGNGSWDPEGDSLSYEWRVEALPAASGLGEEDLSDPGSPSPWFPTDAHGDYVFSLQVFDGGLYSAIDVVTHTVPDPSTNRAPTAQAGPDQAYELEPYSNTECRETTLALDGTLSGDPDSDEVLYSWVVDAPGVDIASPSLPWTEVTLPRVPIGEVWEWTFTLQTSDCEYKDQDTVRVEIACVADD